MVGLEDVVIIDDAPLFHVSSVVFRFNRKFRALQRNAQQNIGLNTKTLTSVSRDVCA